MSALARVGDRVVLLRAPDDPWTKLASGDRGRVAFVDSLGTVHVHWDSGSRLGLVSPEDDGTWRVLTDEEEVLG